MDEYKVEKRRNCTCDLLLMARNTYICYHFSPGLVPLSVVGPLLFLLQHALSRCAILQGKLAQDFAKAMNADLTHRIYWMAEEQEKGVKPADVWKSITEILKQHFNCAKKKQRTCDVAT